MYILLIIGPRGLPQNWSQNCLQLVIDPRGLQCETNLQDIMGWESSDVRFDLWPLLQGQAMVH